MPAKKFVLYHGDADGFGSAWAAWKVFGWDAEYIPVNYGQPAPEMPDGSEVYLLDFSYPIEVLEKLQKRMKRLFVIDHHKTAMGALLPVKEKIYDAEHSAAVLSWKEFHGEPVPELLLYIEDRDLWNFQMRFSHQINTFIESFDFNFEDWNTLAEMFENGHAMKRLIDEGMAIMRWREKLVNRICERAIVRPFGPEHAPEMLPSVNSCCLQSEIGHKLLEIFHENNMVAIYHERGDGLREVSLRSRRGTDCSVLAVKMGGGGHAQAAGYTEALEGICGLC